MIDSTFRLYSIFSVPLYCYSSYGTILNTNKSTLNLIYNFTVYVTFIIQKINVCNSYGSVVGKQKQKSLIKIPNVMVNIVV